jgi:hypothetical protein
LRFLVLPHAGSPRGLVKSLFRSQSPPRQFQWLSPLEQSRPERSRYPPRTDYLADFLASSEGGTSTPRGPRKARERSASSGWLSSPKLPHRIRALGRRRKLGELRA